MELTKVLQAPVVTEKSTTAQANQKYTFLVHPKSNKILVKQAVEAFYGVKVKQVRVIPVLKTTRMAGRGRTITQHPSPK